MHKPGTTREPAYTREEMREACRVNYNMGLEAAARWASDACDDGEFHAASIRALKERPHA